MKSANANPLQQRPSAVGRRTAAGFKNMMDFLASQGHNVVICPSMYLANLGRRRFGGALLMKSVRTIGLCLAATVALAAATVRLPAAEPSGKSNPTKAPRVFLLDAAVLQDNLQRV